MKKSLTFKAVSEIPDLLKRKTRHFVLVMSGAILMVASVSAQPYQERISVNFSDVTVLEAIRQTNSLAGNCISYRREAIELLSKRVTMSVQNVPALQVVHRIMQGTGLSVETSGDQILLTPGAQSTTRPTVSGRVTDESGNPLVGVAVVVEGTTTGTSTDDQGRFSLNLPDYAVTLRVSFIGLETQNIQLAAPAPGRTHDELNVVMRRVTLQVDEVIVTGIFTRSKESFTGSAATYTQKELKTVGTSNILQSLKTIDPSFAMIEDVQFGSDPNRLPNMEIRGKSSMLGMRDELDADPNQPLFILDGFESTLAAINDLDINRIESITILKDAASTAIYGSKAANGVVVVETVKPVAGQLRVNYNGNLNVSMPDLSSYNLMNAAEKLQFEVVAGKYDPAIVETPYQTDTYMDLMQQYNARLRSVAEGVDTYWLGEPVRTGINQKHSLYVQGGEGNFMFGLGGGFNGVTGVMKESNRNIASGNIDLVYRVSKFQFSNKFSVTSTNFANPVVAFSEYAAANPYYKKRNNDGTIEQWLEYNDNAQIVNPLWNASLNSRNIGKNLGLSDYFVAEWNPSDAWKVRARFGITYDNNDMEIFISPDDTNQILDKPSTRRGEFEMSNLRNNQYEGEFTVTYAKVIDAHRINLVAGGNIFSSETLLQGYSAEGFPSGDFTYPSFASGYTENGYPTYMESVSRSVNGYFNIGYSYDDRYLMDFSLRTSGSSVFGSTRKFNTTWSVGLGWNLHHERFLEGSDVINFLKLRASIGNPGNQSFDSGKTLLTYAFQYGSLNYFGLGALPDQIGNPDLRWQITTDKNVGIDLTMFDRRFSLTVDYFHKVTNPLLISINTPYSSGTDIYYTNAGEQTSQGFTFSTVFHILRDTERRILWSVRANGRTQKTRIEGIGNKLDTFNQSGQGVNTVRYYDGADPDDIWTVRSAGIDPSTGKELFYTGEGILTYDYSYDNEVICGNRRPDLEGVVGTSFTWRGLTLNLNLRYQFGADVFNSAVLNKVEAIDMNYNQDRRALYERWQNPGDVRRFKNVRDVNPSPMSSRFIQRENVLALESVYLEYEFMEGWIRKLGLSNLRVFCSMRDVFRASTVRAERGTDYPFARTLEAGLSFNF